MEIKLSIIVPVYNGEKYLKRCLDSILNQTLKNIEIIIVNDGSTDNSINIIKTYKDDRIKLISSEHKNSWAARNIGIKNSIGKYITFVDCDDKIINVDGYYNCLKMIEKENCDYARFRAYYNESDKIKNGSKGVVYNKFILNTLIQKNNIKMIEKDYAGNDFNFCYIIEQYSTNIKDFEYYYYTHYNNNNSEQRTREEDCLQMIKSRFNGKSELKKELIKRNIFNKEKWQLLVFNDLYLGCKNILKFSKNKKNDEKELKNFFPVIIKELNS